MKVVFVSINTAKSFSRRKMSCYHLNSKLAILPILVLLVSISAIGYVNAQTSSTTGNLQTDTTKNMQSVSCTQDEITTAKQGMTEIQKKMSDLKTQYYKDWQTAYNSGQYNGTWQEYSREKISSSPDLSQIKLDYQKYSSVLRSCGSGQMQPQSRSSSTCSQSDVTNARQELATTMQQGMELRNKIYQQFQQDQSSGQFNGTWNQYAQKNFYNLPEVLQLKSTHDKYTNFLKSCFGQQMPTQQYGSLQSPNGYTGTTNPQGQGYSTQGTSYNNMPLPPLPPLGANNPASSSSPSDNLNQGALGNDFLSSNNVPSISSPTGQPQNSLPSISSPTDALGTISSSQGLPPWVKGIAGWWAEGKISDNDFVSAIKFLVHQGIIKV